MVISTKKHKLKFFINNVSFLVSTIEEEELVSKMSGHKKLGSSCGLRTKMEKIEEGSVFYIN